MAEIEMELPGGIVESGGDEMRHGDEYRRCKI